MESIEVYRQDASHDRTEMFADMPFHAFCGYCKSPVDIIYGH